MWHCGPCLTLCCLAASFGKLRWAADVIQVRVFLHGYALFAYSRATCKDPVLDFEGSANRSANYQENWNNLEAARINMDQRKAEILREMKGEQERIKVTEQRVLLTLPLLRCRADDVIACFRAARAREAGGCQEGIVAQVMRQALLMRVSELTSARARQPQCARFVRR